MGSEVQLATTEGNAPETLNLTSVVSGNALIVFIAAQAAGDIFTRSDAVSSDVDGNFTRGNYTDNTSSGADSIYTYYLLNASSGSHTITVNTDGDGSEIIGCAAAEYAEANAAVFGSASTGNSGNSSSPLSGSVTVGESDELVVAMTGTAGASRTHTPDTGWGEIFDTDTDTPTRMAGFDIVNPSTGSLEHSDTLSSSNKWASHAIRFTPAAGGGTTQAVGLVTETDSVLTLSKTKDKSVALSSEATSVLDISIGKLLTAGLSSEADSSFSASILKTLLTGLSTETDSSLDVTVVTPGQTIAVGLSSEADSSFALSSILKTLYPGLLTETDSALSSEKAKQTTIGLSSETDSNQAVSPSKSIVIGLSQDSELSQSVDFFKELSVGLSSEADSSFTVSDVTGYIIAVGLSSEADSALSSVWTKFKLAGIAEESDSSLALLLSGALLWEKLSIPEDSWENIAKPPVRMS